MTKKIEIVLFLAVGLTLTGRAVMTPVMMVLMLVTNDVLARIFDLRFSDGRPFQVIASDGGYLVAPVGLRSLLIAPGERYEVLVDFSNGTAVVLETGATRTSR